MNKLCIYLPPLAPDYSGVCSALYELNGMSVIHDASGCTGNYTGFDEQRWYDDQRFVYCSGLREIDAVLGDDNKLINKLLKANEDLNPEFITVLGSPVPMIIGSDMTGIAKELEYASNKPCLGFDTTGLNYYDVGIKKAYLKLAERFVSDSKEKVKNSINLLGVTPLDFGIKNNVSDLKNVFISNGIKINSCWSMGTSLNEIKETTKAEMNVVVSVSGLELARYLKKKYNMPYCVVLPVGEYGIKKCLDLIKNNVECEEYSKKETVRKDKVLIIGEQVSSNAIRDVLINKYDFEIVDVATFFMLDKEIKEKQDFIIENESYLIKKFREDNYEFIIGDPIIKQLLPDESKTKFIEIPHVAVSSKICWDNSVDIIGNGVYEILDKVNS